MDMERIFRKTTEDSGVSAAEVRQYRKLLRMHI